MQLEAFDVDLYLIEEGVVVVRALVLPA